MFFGGRNTKNVRLSKRDEFIVFAREYDPFIEFINVFQFL